MLPVTVAHYVKIIAISFFDCDKYTDRGILFNSINWLPSKINININILTKGRDFLTYQGNTIIFKHAFKYIKDSKRFSLPVDCPWSVVLSGYSCFFHH